MRHSLSVLAGLLLMSNNVVNAGDGPWPAPVKGFVPPEPGEHPRLLFRRSDLPQLRKRAQTPEGKAILKRLREQLNGSDGESTPTEFNPVVATRAQVRRKVLL